MKQLRFGGMVLGAVVLAAAIASAQAPAPAQGGAPGQGRQGRGAPQPLKNLQVFPKDMTQAQILPIMRNFEAALQVECGHCHVWFGNGNPMNDFASDMKPQKNIARAMIRTVMAANDTIKPAVVQSGLRAQAQEVTCATCHRGMAIPAVPTYQPPAPAGRGAAPGAAPAGGAPGGGAPPTPGRQ